MTESNRENKTWIDKILNVGKIRDALTDDESRILFDTRIDFMITYNNDHYFDVIESLPYKWRCTQLESYMDDEKTNIIIFGCGHDGKITNRILKKCGLSARYYCDSYRFGQVVDGLEVISVGELLEKHIENTVVVLGTSKYRNEIFSMLQEKGYPKDRIIKPYRVLIAEFGHQYFDFFSAEQDEIFVDAGAYNGDTTLEFASWTKKGGGYKKAFVLEPLPDMCLEIENKIKKYGLENVVIENCAAWDKDEKLQFSASGVATKPNANGELSVRGKTIDDIVDGEKVTYIKMDVEGSEFKALLGAQKTIMRCKPKLAISIYHKPYDVIELADYILELVPEYKLGIRQYFSNLWETVLYAYV